jgi:hypothetical protein
MNHMLILQTVLTDAVKSITMKVITAFSFERAFIKMLPVERTENGIRKLLTSPEASARAKTGR